MDRNYMQYTQNVPNVRQQYPNSKKVGVPSVFNSSYHSTRQSVPHPSQGQHHMTSYSNQLLQAYHQHQGSSGYHKQNSLNAGPGPNTLPSQQGYGYGIRYENPRPGIPANTGPSHAVPEPSQQNFNTMNREPNQQAPRFPRVGGAGVMANSQGHGVAIVGVNPQNHGQRSQMFQQPGWGQGGGNIPTGRGGLLGQKPDNIYQSHHQGLLGDQPRSQSMQPSTVQSSHQPVFSAASQRSQTGQSGTSLAIYVGKRHENVQASQKKNTMSSNIQNTRKPNSGKNSQQSNGTLNKNSKKCSLSDCHEKVGSNKEHMMKCHLSKIFNTSFSVENPALHELRMRALKELTMSILGNTSNIDDLCRFLRNQNILPQGMPISDKMDMSFRAFCRHYGYSEPEVFVLHTVNSPALLLHWKALSCLLQYITPVQRREFRNLFHAEGLEFEWDLLKSTKQQQQQQGQPNMPQQRGQSIQQTMAPIPPQSFSIPQTEEYRESRFKTFENQAHGFHSSGGSRSFPDNNPDTGSGQIRVFDYKQTYPTGVEVEQEPLFQTGGSQKDLDQDVSSSSETEEEEQQDSVASNLRSKCLSSSQVRRRRRIAQKKRKRRERKGQRKIKKNYEARRIDRQIKRLNALTTCPVPNCIQTTDLKEHAYKFHLPKIFDVDLPISDPNLHSMRWKSLRDLTTFVLSPDAHIEDLLDFFRSKNIMPQEAKITPSMEISMRALCQHQGLQIPHQFSIWPPNSPAILLHWRALLGLLKYVSVRFQKLFKSSFAKATINGLSLEDVKNPCQQGLNLVTKKDKNVQQSSRSKEEDINTGNQGYEVEPRNFNTAFNDDRDFPEYRDQEYSRSHQELEGYRRKTPHPDFDRQVLPIPFDEPRLPQRLSLMDSHFYFGRLCMMFNVAEINPSELLSKLAVHSRPNVPVDIIGGTVVYSNPKSFALGGFPNYPGWRNCFGVDASAAPGLLQEEFEAVSVLTNSADAAFGDIGLDRSGDKELWMEQEMKFRQLLTLSTPAQPMILKVTGPHGDPYSFDVGSRVRDLVRRHCSPEQHIHLCNFKGGEVMVREWLEDFPNCFFGFSRRVLEFDEHQTKGLRAVPDDRLLLESDVVLVGEEQGILENSPLFLGEVAFAVATIRDDSLDSIAHTTVSNTCRLYNL